MMTKIISSCFHVLNLLQEMFGQPGHVAEENK